MREPRLVKHRERYAVRFWDAAAGEWRRHSLGTDDPGLARTRLGDWVKQRERLSRPDRVTLRQIMEGYIDDRRAEGIPVQRIEDAWKRLGDHFGDLLPAHVDRAACQRYLRARTGAAVARAGTMGGAPKAASIGTVHTELGILRTACRWAAKEWHVGLANVWLPRKPSPRERFLTRAESKRLLAGCDAPHVRLFVVLALNTGGRAGALLDLTWDRVDLPAKRLSLDDPDRPRTRKGRASVPINDTLGAALEEARKGAISPFVIEWAGDRVRSVKHAFRRAAQRAKLKGVTPHVLRHTAAVWMAERRTPMEEIAQYLGHSDSRTTERIYARFSPDHLRRASQALEDE